VAVKKHAFRVVVLGLAILLALFAIYCVRTEEVGGGFADLEIAFFVTDATTGRPVPDAHIAVYEQSDSSPKLLRADADGTVSFMTNRQFTVHTIVHPLTGRRKHGPRVVSVPEWLIVISAQGYQPPEPWRLSSDSDHPAEDRGKSFYLPVHVKLEPQTP
jgi:hypothetical protein